MKKLGWVLSIISLFIAYSCATFEAQYANKNSSSIDVQKPIEKKFYLIGDAGKSKNGEMSEGLKAFKSKLTQDALEDDVVLFLGDNIYPSGMPGKNEEGYTEAKNALDLQIDAVENFKGKVVFIPGNHDWYTDSNKGLKRQEKYIEDALGKNTFLPENGCPIESIKISDNVQLIVVDSQWYLEDWDKSPTINDKCEIKTRTRFFDELEGELKKAQNKSVVIAIHHPLYSNGSHGGYFSAKKHLYPTQKKFPLPILASVLTQIRSQGGVSPQDQYNKGYSDLVNRIETLAYEAENVMFVSGHEHTLQYIEENNIKQIVSGSGSKSSEVSLGNNGLFSYGGQGFAEYIIYKDKSALIKFYAAEDGKPKLVYTKPISAPKKENVLTTTETKFPKDIETSVYSEAETKKSGLFKTLWGEHYRDLYSTKIKAKVATLDTLFGGLEIVRKGGGHQTRSLRLKTKEGKQLNMRALRKSATQYLQTVLFKDTYVQDQFKDTSVEDFISDFYTAAHPYAFLVVPDLSEAAKVFHTNPKLFYIPKQKHLGVFNSDFGDELYVVEVRPEKNYANTPTFDYANDIVSTHDVIKKIRKDEKYSVDEAAFVRARLFDMLLGDWDRHQDQWRWAQFNNDNGNVVYKPIPRDRDQVFSKFDGALLNILRKLSGATNQLQVYDEDVDKIGWLNSAGIKLDRALIKNSDAEVWIEQAQFIQDNVTEAVINNAFNNLPDEIKNEALEELKSKLISRKAKLKDIAKRYYEYLNKLVILTATDKDDYIEVIRKENKQTQVVISRIKKGEKSKTPYVSRTFNKNTTKEIWIYGLDDDDVFEVKGTAQNVIKVRLIGGQNNDKYNIENGNSVTIYDHKSKTNSLDNSGNATVTLTDLYDVNLYDFEKTINRNSIVSPLLGFNPDDGISLGLSYTLTNNNFKRNPFTNKHQFKGGYFFATDGFTFNYAGEFANILGSWNLRVENQITSENFTNNFFGYGNETENFDEEFDFNRVKTSIYALDIGIVKRGRYGSDFGIKLELEGIQLGATEDRFITEFAPETNTDFYDRRYFTGIATHYNYQSFDDKLNPSRGMHFTFDAGAKTELNEDYTYGFINANIGFYNALSKNKKWVLKTDVRSQFRIGNDILFYQAANIGGRNGLRGYRIERFTGSRSLVGSADLRYSFNSFRTSFVPIQMGVFGGLDVGRVWLSNDFSEKWHNNFGGGFWVTAANSVSGTFNFFNSPEGFRVSFGFGIGL